MVLEGYVNLPLSPIAAVRLVAWDEHDAGYIHNIAGTNVSAGIVDGVRTFPVGTGCPCTVDTGFPPVPGTEISNVGETNSQYNTAETRGGRVAGLVNLGDNWTISPLFMGQILDSKGFFGTTPPGDLNVARFGHPRAIGIPSPRRR